MSNFLGEVSARKQPTHILAARELIEREGMEFKKGMNFRKEFGMHSVFLVLPSHEGEFKDEWCESTSIYTYEGHDSTTKETNGKSVDQLLMYADGKLTDNGKFYKVAREYAERVRMQPLCIQVYEKLDTGAWYDKGLFDLVDARRVHEDGRMLCKFDLHVMDAMLGHRDVAAHTERMIDATTKSTIWKRDNGRCTACKAQTGLRFVPRGKKKGDAHLLCARCRGESSGMLGV